LHGRRSGGLERRPELRDRHLRVMREVGCLSSDLNRAQRLYFSVLNSRC
jgi:hypothetical protein